MPAAPRARPCCSQCCSLPAHRCTAIVWGYLGGFGLSVCVWVFFRVFLHISSQLPYPNRDGEVSKISSFYPTAPGSTLAGKAAQLSQVRDNWDQRDNWDRRGQGSHGQHAGSFGTDASRNAGVPESPRSAAPALRSASLRSLPELGPQTCPRDYSNSSPGLMEW